MNQDRVHFNCDYFLRPRQQELSESPFAGPNFDHQKCIFPTGRGRDGFQDGFAGQEVLPEAAAQDYPFTSMRLEWNQRRNFDAMGWPKLVAGVKFENTRAFSSRRRISPLARTLAPATMA